MDSNRGSARNWKLAENPDLWATLEINQDGFYVFGLDTKERALLFRYVPNDTARIIEAALDQLEKNSLFVQNRLVAIQRAATQVLDDANCALRACDSARGQKEETP